MVIYVEYVVVDNMVINCLILLLCQKIGKFKTNKIRIFLSSSFGTILSLLSPMLSGIVAILVKPFVALCMVIIAYSPKKFSKLVIEILLFFLVTFVFGGACLGVVEIFGLSYLKTDGTTVYYNFPVGLALLVCAFAYVCIKNIIKYCLNQQKIYEQVYQISLAHNNKQVLIDAFLDTGNCVTYNGMPVTIINFKAFSKLFPQIDLTSLLLKKNLPLKNQSKINIKGIGHSGEELLCFQIDEIKYKEYVTKDAVVALTLNNFSKTTNSDAIISKNILGDWHEFVKN